MAFFITARFLIKQFLKSEVIMNKVSQTNFPVINIADKYLNELRSMDIEQKEFNASDFLKFPLKTFYKYPKLTMESIIKESFDILSEKGFVSTDLYEKLVDACFIYDIDVNTNDIMKSMTDKRVQINKTIYSYFIRNLSLNGQIKDTEKILDEMKSNRIDVSDTEKYIIVTGYMISGQQEQAEIFTRNHNLSSDESKLSFAKCYAYAATNNSSALLNILTENDQKGIKFYTADYFSLYHCLIESNASQTVMNQIIDASKKNVGPCSSDLFGTIARLNASDYYHQSIFLIYKFLPFIDDNVTFIELFSYSKCPLDIYEKVLHILIRRAGFVRTNTNIFSGFDINSALEISRKFAKENWRIIYFSLINRAADERSPDVLHNVLDICLQMAGWRYFNDVLVSVFFESLQRTEMIRDYEDVFNLLPRFKDVMLKVILMKYLCSGDYDRYNQLRLRNETSGNIIISFSWKLLSNNIHKNLNIEQIKQWSEEAHKCFSWKVVANLLSYIYYEEVIRLAKSESWDELDHIATGLLREWNLHMLPIDIKSFLVSIPEQHRSIVESSVSRAINTINLERKSRTK